MRSMQTQINKIVKELIVCNIDVEHSSCRIRVGQYNKGSLQNLQFAGSVKDSC